MTTPRLTAVAKKMVIVMALFVAIVAAILILSFVRLILFPPQTGGLAAVSAGISEAIVEGFLLLLVGLVGWRVWRRVRSRRRGYVTR